MCYINYLYTSIRTKGKKKEWGNAKDAIKGRLIPLTVICHFRVMLKVKVRILGGPTSEKGEEGEKVKYPMVVDLYVQRKCL